MEYSKVELLLHPERFRLIASFAGGKRTYTAQQLITRFPDIAPATLYRHLNRLVQAGVLQVAEERAVGNRNMREKVYALAEGAASIEEIDLEYASTQELSHAISLFLSLILEGSTRYLEHQERLGLAEKEILLRRWHLSLSDEEYVQAIQAIHEALLPWLELPPDPKRSARIFALEAFPERELQEPTNGSAET
jgi:hypothetical protein